MGRGRSQQDDTSSRHASLSGTELNLWMCFFCNNQRKVLLEHGDGSREREHMFEDCLRRIARAGSVVAILDGYVQPVYTTRLWCMYEVFRSTSIGVQIDVAFPK